jgi:hypothetical protein
LLQGQGIHSRYKTSRRAITQKAKIVMVVTEATGQCWQHTFSEDGKSASAGVGFHKGNLRPHSLVIP